MQHILEEKKQNYLTDYKSKHYDEHVVENLLYGGDDLTIKELREAKRLSQSDLAALMGVDQTAVSQWERGITQPRAAKLPELAKVLGCTIDALYGQIGKLKGAGA